MCLLTASAIELTPENWEDKTVGKTVFIKMFAPWVSVLRVFSVYVFWTNFFLGQCGHCKKIKPAWDNLMEKYAESDTLLVADVDCVNAGKELCDKNGVKGFPTIKYGSVNSLEDYKGGRSASDLEEFASKLTPPCNPETLEHCSATQQEQLSVYESKTDDELQEMITGYEKAQADIDTTFKKGVEGLQGRFEELQKEKDQALGELEDVGTARVLLGKRKQDQGSVEL